MDGRAGAARVIMKRRLPAILIGVLLLVLVIGLTVLFRLRLSQGDVFPMYSSLRSDPLGTLAFCDSLARIPGLKVERNFKKITTLARTPPRALILAGVPTYQWSYLTEEEFNFIDSSVRAGSRLIVAMQGYVQHHDARGEADDPVGEKIEPGPSEESTKPSAKIIDLKDKWGIEILSRALAKGANGAFKAEDVDASLPGEVGWKSDLYFKTAEGVNWRTLYQRGDEPVLVELSLGRGSIVFASDSYFLSNESLQSQRSTGLLVWIVGEQTRVMFDESHLGVVTDPGVAALARRYGLAGAFLTLLLLAALFIWRRTALFVPPIEEPAELALNYHPAAGLEALLRRSVPLDKIMDVALTEWKRTARKTDEIRVGGAAEITAKPASVVDRYNQITRALRRR